MEKGLIELLKLSSQYLSQHGVPNSRLDAEVLLADILNTDRIGLYVNYDRPISSAEISRYRIAVAKRAIRIPVAYITGKKEFMSMDFHVEDGVLIPRPDTEVLVDTVVQYLITNKIQTPRILDLCTGTGAIACSLAKAFGKSKVVATDISDKAINVACKNVEKLDLSHQVTVIKGDLYDAVMRLEDKQFDVIVSNPPYIPTNQIKDLEPEVSKYEPKLALDGGEDGMKVITRILDQVHDYVTNGFVCLEVGDTLQANLVASKMKEYGLTNINIVKDFAGLDRAVSGVIS